MTSTVPRVPFLSAPRFHAEFLERAPVVMTQMLERWPARRSFTVERLRRSFGELWVTLRRHGADRATTFLEQSKSELRNVRLGEWLDVLEGRAPFDDDPAAWAMRESHELFDLCPELLGELDFAGLFPRGHKRFSHFLWLGPPGYATGLHTDELAVNLLAHFVGRKTVTVYGPEQTELLYPETTRAVQDGMYSAVNVFAPDLVRHPRFAEARPMVAELAPGDLLYLPRGFWHWVRGHDLTLSVTGSSHSA